MPRATGYVARRSNSIHRRPRSSCPGQRGTRPGSIHKSMRGILSEAYSNTPRFVPAPSSHADMRTRSFARLTTVGVRSSSASLSTEYNEQAIMTAPNQGRGRHAPRSGVLARRWNNVRRRHAPCSEVRIGVYGRRRHAPRSGVRRP